MSLSVKQNANPFQQGQQPMMQSEPMQASQPAPSGAQVAEAQQESAPQEQEQEQEDDNAGLYEYIESIGGPSRAQIEDMKKRFGGIHLLPLGEDRIFIYRSLKRGEWAMLRDQLSKIEGMTMEQKQQQIVERCLLFPQLTAAEWMTVEAGLVDSLHTAISASSFFFEPQQIQNLIVKL